MSKSSFPGPRYNTVPDSDQQIKVVPLNNADWGARRVSTEGPTKNDKTIKHQGGGSTGEG